MQLVGMEGSWGVLWTTLVLLAMEYIPCHWTDLCPSDRLDSFSQALADYDANHFLIWLTVLTTLTSTIFNSFAVSVTKYATSSQTSTIDISRTAVVWVFFLATPIDGVESHLMVCSWAASL